MSTSSITYKCDRCPAEAAGSTTGAMLPVGWLMFSIGGQGYMPSGGHLCSNCGPEFVTFMKASGGNFELAPILPPLSPPPIEPASAPAGD